VKQRPENRIGILISGRGSNMRAILDRIAAGDLEARAALVISNEASAAGLAVARERGVPTLIIDHRDSRTREEHDRKLASALDSAGVELVCLAGYMRLLTPWFVRHFEGRILNIHPSLLPSFPGRNAARQAIEAGVAISGCTVHLVDEQVDSGPIILQEAVPVLPDDDEESLAARILQKEHILYSRAIALYFSGPLRIAGRRAPATGS
jgi:phosphoribosylglycinamide formyltransferase 1